MDAANANIVALAGIQGAAMFAALMPNLQEVRRADPSSHPEFVADMRTAEAMSAGITLGIAAIVAVNTKSETPFLIGVAATVSLIAAYEFILYRAGTP